LPGGRRGIEGSGGAADIRPAVSVFFPQPADTPCPECGASIGDEEEHVCDPQQLLDYAVFQLREEIDGFGRLEAWEAERRRHDTD
jgi:hypothetical protein